MRDDHDSTKKRGQIQNFEKKLNVMLEHYTEKKLIGIFYFIDPGLLKNKNYYKAELQKMKNDYNIDTLIFYGKGLFDFLGFPDIWEEINGYLVKWKRSIPDLPEINFDLDAQHTFEEIKDLKPMFFRKILENQDLVDEILTALFPENKTLILLQDYFSQKDGTIYKTITKKIKERL